MKTPLRIAQRAVGRDFGTRIADETGRIVCECRGPGASYLAEQIVERMNNAEQAKATNVKAA